MDDNKDKNVVNTTEKNKKKKTIILVVSIVSAVIIIGLVVFFVLTCGKGKQETPVSTTAATEESLNIQTHGLTGAVLEINKESIIVNSGTITAVFDVDENTAIAEGAAVGDIVTVTYYGDLFEEPYAMVVEIKAKGEAKTKEMNGQVSEKSDTSMKVAVASSNGFVFTINKDTKITGKADKITVGDMVKVTYTGELGKSPVAQTVEIVKLSDIVIYKKINVTVETISKDSFTGKSNNNTYTFYTTSKTKYTGEKFEKGCTATVRYTGDIKDKPQVDSVYVTKKAPITPTTKPTTAPTTKPTTQPEPTTPTSEPTQETEAPEDVYVPNIGVILSWDGDSCKIQTIDYGTLDLKITNITDIAVGYYPSEGDIVHLVFGKNTNVLKELQLLIRPNMAAEGTVVSWSSDSCTLELSDADVKTFKECYPDSEIDDNTVTVKINPYADIPTSLKPEKGDKIIFALAEIGDQPTVIFAREG